MTLMGEVSLKNFFIYNPSLAKIEGEEHKKILFYYPNNIDTNVQLKNAGLCEALIQFTKSFRPETPCEVFTTEYTKQILYEAEPGYWMIMTASASRSATRKGDPSEIIQDGVCKAVLRLAYRMFILFTNTFSEIVQDHDSDEQVEVLRQQLDNFYRKYVSSINLEASNILDVFQGIQFLPLGRGPFLHVLSFINLVEAKFPCTKHSAFLYNDHLVWSSIAPSDMQILYHYLVHTLLPSHPDLELQGGSLPGTSPTLHYGSFVTGPPDLQHSIVSSEKVPKVYLTSDSCTRCFHLVVYRALSATICLFLKDDTVLNLKLFQDLDEHIGPRLTSLVSEVSEHCVRNGPTPTIDPGPKFIYFNKLNLAIKSSIMEQRKATSSALTPDVMRILADINLGQEQYCDNGEIIAKTLSDTWIVAKFSNGREFYVVTQKKASLMEIGLEVERICEAQLKGIFFMD